MKEQIYMYCSKENNEYFKNTFEFATRYILFICHSFIEAD